MSKKIRVICEGYFFSLVHGKGFRRVRSLSNAELGAFTDIKLVDEREPSEEKEKEGRNTHYR